MLKWKNYGPERWVPETCHSSVERFRKLKQLLWGCYLGSRWLRKWICRMLCLFRHVYWMISFYLGHFVKTSNWWPLLTHLMNGVFLEGQRRQYKIHLRNIKAYGANMPSDVREHITKLLKTVADKSSKRKAKVITDSNKVLGYFANENIDRSARDAKKWVYIYHQ